MKGKYITTQIRLACLSKLPAKTKDIHAQLADTINMRKQLAQQYGDIILSGIMKKMDVEPMQVAKFSLQ